MLNGRDAMAGAGILRLRLLGGQRIPGVRGQTGPFAAISVTDKGVGIAAPLLERIFDPFFTTKPAGEGTGLGLSQVFGFAKQSGGDVQVTSVPGQGTTFTLYLPQEAAPLAEPSSVAQSSSAPRVDGDRRRILLVEDNPDVDGFTVQMLEDQGYCICWACSAE
ncbi:Blue-light-activated protein [compost metagenome]